MAKEPIDFNKHRMKRLVDKVQKDKKPKSTVIDVYRDKKPPDKPPKEPKQ